MRRRTWVYPRSCPFAKLDWVLFWHHKFNDGAWQNCGKVYLLHVVACHFIHLFTWYTCKSRWSSLYTCLRKILERCNALSLYFTSHSSCLQACPQSTQNSLILLFMLFYLPFDHVYLCCRAHVSLPPWITVLKKRKNKIKKKWKMYNRLPLLSGKMLSSFLLYCFTFYWIMWIPLKYTNESLLSTNKSKK